MKRKVDNFKGRRKVSEMGPGLSPEEMAIEEEEHKEGEGDGDEKARKLKPEETQEEIALAETEAPLTGGVGDEAPVEIGGGERGQSASSAVGNMTQERGKGRFSGVGGDFVEMAKAIGEEAGNPAETLVENIAEGKQG